MVTLASCPVGRKNRIRWENIEMKNEQVEPEDGQDASLT